MWRLPPMDHSLHSGELQVWRVPLDLTTSTYDRLAATLTDEECRRASHFYCESVRRRWTAARGILRSILGRYLRQPPDRLSLRVRPGGKPELIPMPGVPPVHFNLSHSDGLALIALSLGAEVGVDVERWRPLSDVLRLAESCFSPVELATLRAMPADLREPGFFRCWTRKEAYVKARGEGIALGLERFSVAFGPREPPRLLRMIGEPDEASRWRMYDLDPGPGYSAACVAERTTRTPVLWDWSED